MGRMRGIVEQPQGLRYIADLIDDGEERQLLQRLTQLDYGEVRMHGQVARRVVRHYGVGYSFDSGAVAPGEPIPEWLMAVRERCAALIERDAEALAEALATYYPPGATIGWHRDAPAFGTVVGVSLNSACLLRFQYGSGTSRRVFEQALAPRSAYVLDGPARTRWQHSIPALASARYSLTFRTIRRGWREPSQDRPSS